MEESEQVFLGLCSVCGADYVHVSECPECGYLSCEKCRNSSGLYNICSDVLRACGAMCLRKEELRQLLFAVGKDQL